MGGLIPVVGGNRSAQGHGQHAHSAGHDAHSAGSGALVHEADTDSPFGIPHTPAQCILAVGCGAAVIAAAVVTMDEPAHAVGRVEADVALTPDSPAPGLEPPPPRA